MQRLPSRGTRKAWLVLIAIGLLGCDDATSTRLARRLTVGEEQSGLGRPQGSFKQQLGIIAERTEVYAEPRGGSRLLGNAVAGTLLPRSDNPVGREGCAGGWYAISPRGYICFDKRTTLDERHPTLQARALGVNNENVLPYPYAVTRREATLFEPDPKHTDGVRVKRKISKGSVFAVVGTWNALDEFDQRQRLALLTSGQFVSVRDIEPAALPKPVGISLDPSQNKLPLAFVLANETTETPPLAQGQVIALTGTSRLIDSVRHWTRTTGGTVRDRDVAVVRKRQEFPSSIGNNTHFADLDLEHGTLVLYEGRTPIYATLAIRLPLKKPNAGTSYVKNKQVTANGPLAASTTEELKRDLAWVIELENGLLVHAATGPRGAGEPSPTGAVELHPDDAKRLFQWLAPELPEKWHGVVVNDSEKEGAPFLLH